MAQIWNPLLGQYVEIPDDQLNQPAVTQNVKGQIPVGAQKDGTYQFSNGTYDPRTNDFNGAPLSQSNRPSQSEWEQYGAFVGQPQNQKWAPSSTPDAKTAYDWKQNPDGSWSNPNTGYTKNSPTGGVYADPTRPYYNNLLNIYGQTADADQGVINGLQQDNGVFNQWVGDAASFMGNNLQSQYAKDQAYVDKSQGLTDRLGQYVGQSNQAQADNTGQYTAKLAGYNQRNDAAVAGLGDLYGKLATPLQSQVSWAGDLSSQAAVADPAALAAQNNALGFLGGAMGGSLDYTSQGAQAYADPRYTAMLEKGIGDLYGVSQGSMDVKPGDLDPAAYQSSVAAMNKYKDLSDPRVTAQEQFMFEQARLKQEQDERANRAAVMTNLNQRGMGGSGMELTSAALGNQQTSQNRLLSDLGTLANADARSMSALGGWSQAAQGLNTQANALATANQQRKLAALGAYTDATGQLRGASFDEAYKRGIAADNASANNQQTRLQGGIAYGNQANTMQQQAYNRGMAADEMSRYNRSASIDVSKFNSLYAQSERDAQWNRGTDMTNTILKGNAQNALNDTNAWNATDKTIGDSYARNRDWIGSQDVTNQRQNAADHYQTDTTNGLTQWVGVQRSDALNRGVALGGLQMNNNNLRGQGAIDVTKLQIGDLQADKARQSAVDAQKYAAAHDNGGLLSLNGGFSVLGQKIISW